MGSEMCIRDSCCTVAYELSVPSSATVSLHGVSAALNLAQPKTEKWFCFPSDFSLIFTVELLTVVLLLDKADYPENMQDVFCPDK